MYPRPGATMPRRAPRSDPASVLRVATYPRSRPNDQFPRARLSVRDRVLHRGVESSRTYLEGNAKRSVIDM